jgi:hypothetical protein
LIIELNYILGDIGKPRQRHAITQVGDAWITPQLRLDGLREVLGQRSAVADYGPNALIL